MAKQRAIAAAEDQALGFSKAHVGFDVVDTRMLSYEFCTPDYVMGALIVDPTLKLADASADQAGHEAGYPGLTAQNRYHAIQFATGLDAHVVPQCLGLKNGKTYNQQQAVQHKNIQLVQRNKNGKQTGPMRIFFSKGMKERLVETNGWYCLQEGSAFLAVKASAPSDASAVSCSWDNEYWLRPKDPDAPVALVAGRQPRFHGLADFIAYVGGFTARAEGSRFTLAGADADGAACALTLRSDLGGVPEVDGKPVNFTPKKLYDSPFIDSDYGSGVVTISRDVRKLTLDFNSAGPQ
jgi:hypothetical protein